MRIFSETNAFGQRVILQPLKSAEWQLFVEDQETLQPVLEGASRVFGGPRAFTNALPEYRFYCQRLHCLPRL